MFSDLNRFFLIEEKFNRAIGKQLAYFLHVASQKSFCHPKIVVQSRNFLEYSSNLSIFGAIELKGPNMFKIFLDDFYNKF